MSLTGKQELKRHAGALTITQWMAAYSTYSVACVATRNLDMATLLNHQHMCLRAGDVIHKKDYRWSPNAACIKYDELQRREWARRSKIGADVDIVKEAVKLCDDTVTEVTQLNPPFQKGSDQSGHEADDANWKARRGRGKGKGNGKGEKGKKGKGKGGKGKKGKPRKTWGKKFYNDDAKSARQKVLDSPGYKAHGAGKPTHE